MFVKSQSRARFVLFVSAIIIHSNQTDCVMRLSCSILPRRLSCSILPPFCRLPPSARRRAGGCEGEGGVRPAAAGSGPGPVAGSVVRISRPTAHIRRTPSGVRLGVTARPRLAGEVGSEGAWVSAPGRTPPYTLDWAAEPDWPQVRCPPPSPPHSTPHSHPHPTPLSPKTHTSQPMLATCVGAWVGGIDIAPFNPLPSSQLLCLGDCYSPFQGSTFQNLSAALFQKVASGTDYKCAVLAHSVVATFFLGGGG